MTSIKLDQIEDDGVAQEVNELLDERFSILLQEDQLSGEKEAFAAKATEVFIRGEIDSVNRPGTGTLTKSRASVKRTLNKDQLRIELADRGVAAKTINDAIDASTTVTEPRKEWTIRFTKDRVL